MSGKQRKRQEAAMRAVGIPTKVELRLQREAELQAEANRQHELRQAEEARVEALPPEERRALLQARRTKERNSMDVLQRVMGMVVGMGCFPIPRTEPSSLHKQARHRRGVR